jgi:tRNA(Arg) A34 adenosine deaminase TadA
MSNLEQYLHEPVSKLVASPFVLLSEPQKERHRIFSLLLMSLTRWYWNGNKNKRSGEYPLNPCESQGDIATYLESDYLGHNIAAIAVDADGRVIDFEFNHNELYNSSAEHAEARLVHRVFSLAQVHDSWNLNGGSIPEKSYGNMLTDVSFYTTLESCSQCSGIMALAMVKEVIFLQQDPSMYSIGNILRRLTAGTSLQAPLPIAGEAIGLSYYRALNEGYADFAKQQNSKKGVPFFRQRNGHDLFSSSITSYLCTRAPYLIFKQAELAFESMDSTTLDHPNYRPSTTALTNDEAVLEAKQFYAYATRKARRGTPHH